MNGKYILNENGEPVLVDDLIQWARWLEGSCGIRGVARNKYGKARISTVFLGLDHSFGEGPPVLWETMVFGGSMDGHQERCSGSREQAEAMHERVVQLVKDNATIWERFLAWLVSW